MKSLKELELLESSDNLSNLEASLWDFIQGRNSDLLNSTELINGLEFYGETVTNFWVSQFSLNTLELFLKQDYLKRLATDWFFQSEETKSISGTLNLKSNSFSSDFNKILNLINPTIYEEDISLLKQNLLLLEDSLEKNISVRLIREHKSFTLIPLSEEISEVSNLQKCLNLLSIPLLGAILFASPGALAQDKNAVLQESIKTTKIYKQAESLSKDIEHKTVELIKDLGGEIPAAVIGIGIKAGIEKKVEVKGSSDIIPVKYEVSIGLEESNFKLKNDTLFEKNIETWLSGTSKDNQQKIEVGLRYDF